MWETLVRPGRIGLRPGSTYEPEFPGESKAFGHDLMDRAATAGTATRGDRPGGWSLSSSRASGKIDRPAPGTLSGWSGICAKVYGTTRCISPNTTDFRCLGCREVFLSSCSVSVPESVSVMVSPG